MLRKTTYKLFGVKQASDFMAHNPVSFEELEKAPIPGYNDWRYDFNEGYQNSHWNRAIIGRLVKTALEDFAQPAEFDSVDPKWLEQQAAIQMRRYRTEWARLKPRAQKGGGIETKEEAEARTVSYLTVQQVKKKSQSSKTRVCISKR